MPPKPGVSNSVGFRNTTFGVCRPVERFFVECAREFHYRGSLCS